MDMDLRISEFEDEEEAMQSLPSRFTDLDEHILLLQAALRRWPTSFQLNSVYESTLCLSGRYARRGIVKDVRAAQRAALQTMLDVDPTSVETLVSMGMLESCEDNKDLAIGYFLKAIRLGDDVDAYTWIARCHRSLGQFTLAREYLDAATKIWGGNVENIEFEKRMLTRDEEEAREELE